MLEGSPDVLGLSQGKGIGSRLGKVAAGECSGIFLVLGERHTSVRPDKPQTLELSASPACSFAGVRPSKSGGQGHSQTAGKEAGNLVVTCAGFGQVWEFLCFDFLWLSAGGLDTR